MYIGFPHWEVTCITPNIAKILFRSADGKRVKCSDIVFIHQLKSTIQKQCKLEVILFHKSFTLSHDVCAKITKAISGFKNLSRNFSMSFA